MNLQPKLLDERQTTIYKKDESVNYQLKMKASRFIISEINQNFPYMPFTARCLFNLLKHFILKKILSRLLTLPENLINTGHWRRKGHDLDLWSV